jgi:hypothetical protein
MNRRQQFIRTLLAMAREGDVPIREQLYLVETVWCHLAAEVRRQALAFPGGFPEEQARQLRVLRRFADYVKAETPDLELARLIEEGDALGAIEHLRRLSAEEDAQ